MERTGTEFRGWRRVFLPVRRLVELGLSGENAYKEGLRSAKASDYAFALRMFQVAERKFRRSRGAVSDDALAALAGQAYCQLKLERYVLAEGLAQSVLSELGERVAVKGVKREAIEEYRRMAASAASKGRPHESASS